MKRALLQTFFLTFLIFGLMMPPVHAAPEMLTLNQRTSHYMNLNQRITRIAVGSPEIATVIQLPGSTSEFLVVTKNQQGSTALFVWTADGARHEYIITVSQEDPGQALMIEQAIGLPDVHVKMVGQRVLLTGTVEDQYEKNYVLQTVRLFVGKTSDSSLLVGSGFDMKLDTQDSKSRSSQDIELAKSENSGEIIDLLQIRNPTQIRLEAQIIEINSDDAKELGIQYNTGSGNGIFTFGESYTRDSHTTITEDYLNTWSRNYSGDWTAAGSTNIYNGTPTGTNDWSDGNSFSRNISVSYPDLVSFANNPLKWVGQHFAPINMTLTALVTKGKARVLSRPSVVTLSGEQATIHIGGEIPYYEYDEHGKLVTNWKEYGIILQFKPVVDDTKRISSAVHAEVSNLNGTTTTGDPIIAVRRADSVINLNSGGTMVIGGLMDSSESKNVTKIPLLGDIPILGEFFKHTSTSRDKRELIILVTPHIIGYDEGGQTDWSPSMQQWYELNQKYRDTMTKVDFNKPKVADDATADDKETERKYFGKTTRETTEPFTEK